MFHQAPVFTPHENIDSCQGATSEVLWNYICQKWCKSKEDSKLKNSKELLVNLTSQNLSHINNIKTYDFSTLYMTIPHDKLKTRHCNIIDSCFFSKNGKKKYSYLVIGHSRNYFVKLHSDSTHKYSEVDIKAMLEFLIDNIFVVFGNQVFKQSVGIPMGTNCAPSWPIFIFLWGRIHSKASTWKEEISSGGL